MGNSDAKIQTSSLDESLIRAQNPPLPTKYIPPFRKFGQLLHKHTGRMTKYIINVLQPYREEIQIETEVFTILKDAFDAKTEQIVIQNVLEDDQVTQRWVFATTTNNKQESILIRPFQSDDSHSYSNILCEIHFAQQISQLQTPNLHKFVESYAIHTGIDSLQESNSQIIVMQKIDANLNQIIDFRRKNKWDWSLNEFQKLAHDLIQGLSFLHEAGISHNDIRPSNVYFSSKKNCYLLGSYSNCFKKEGNTSSSKVRFQSNFNAPESSHKSEFDLLHGDVYSLGLTLLCSFYLAQPLDRKLFLQQNKIYSQKFPILTLIQAMIAPSEQRVSIAQIKSKLHMTNYSYQNMTQFLNSMEHRSRPTPLMASAAKLAASWAYMRLGLWNEWKKQYEEGYELIETSTDNNGKASALFQLALIDHCRGQFESSSNYAKRAAKIYRAMGQQQILEGVLGQAENYFKKAIDCAKYYEFQHDLDLAWSLQGLSNVHSEKNEYQHAKTLSATASNTVSKAAGKQSLEFCKMRIKEAKLQTLSAQFAASDRILQQCLAIARQKQGLNDQAKLLIAQIYRQKGYNYFKQASLQDFDNQQQYLAIAEANLKEAKDIYETIDQDHHYQLALVVKNFGQIQYQRQNFQLATDDFTKALNLLNHHERDVVKRQTRQKGDILCLKGFSQSVSGQQNEAIDDFSEALNVYKRLYGSDHNRWSALAMGNLGRIYANMKEPLKSRQCLKICLSILGDIVGQKNSDYQHFKIIEQNLDKLV